MPNLLVNPHWMPLGWDIAFIQPVNHQNVRHQNRQPAGFVGDRPHIFPAFLWAAIPLKQFGISFDGGQRRLELM